MATTGAATHDDFLRQFMDKNFLDSILNQFDEMFSKLGIIDQYLFSGYAKFIDDVQNFKNSLLKFVLESKIHLTVLKDNFEKPRYQQASDQVKLNFIKERLDKINRATLFDYITACQKLIKRSLDLHEEYGTALFKFKYIALNVLGFTAIGAAAGFSIGLALPFLSAIEMGVGAGIGAITGLAYVTYQFVVKWKQQMAQIEIISQNLREINDALLKVKERLKESYNKLGQSQEELTAQRSGDSFQEMTDLEQYVIATHYEFFKLEKVLMDSKPLEMPD
jgi:hypothetical protein